MRRATVTLGLLLLISSWATGQDTQAPMTNADVISMTKSGIGEQTIVLAIKQATGTFDTSPQALIALKNAGVSEQVMNAMLVAPHISAPPVSTPTVSAPPPAPAQPSVDGRALLQKALDATGPREKLLSVTSLRTKASFIEAKQGRAISFVRDYVRVYPDKAYLHIQPVTGSAETEVITPEFNYRTKGKMTVAVPDEALDSIRQRLTFDKFVIAQHLGDYTAEITGEEEVSGITAEILKIGISDKSIVWKVDPQTGRTLATVSHRGTGDEVETYSVFRDVDGLSTPFQYHIVTPDYSVDETVEEVGVNPVLDAKMFDRPKDLPTKSIVVKVLQEQSVPYTQDVGGGIHTGCNISGTRMTCDTYDTTVHWPHVLNTMFAEANDGNDYIIACDRAWRWSSCVPLRTGDKFNAVFTGKGLQVQSYNSNGKEDDHVYSVVQSKVR